MLEGYDQNSRTPRTLRSDRGLEHEIELVRHLKQFVITVLDTQLVHLLMKLLGTVRIRLSTNMLQVLTLLRSQIIRIEKTIDVILKKMIRTQTFSRLGILDHEIRELIHMSTRL